MNHRNLTLADILVSADSRPTHADHAGHSTGDKCPECGGADVTDNGQKFGDGLTFLCMECGEQFSGDAWG